MISGSTISQDKDLLETTENPILSQLRKDKGYRSKYQTTDKERVQEALSGAKIKLAQTRKKRSATLPPPPSTPTPFLGLSLKKNGLILLLTITICGTFKGFLRRNIYLLKHTVILKY